MMFALGVIAGILLCIFDTLRTKIPTPIQLFKQIYPEQGSVVQSKDPLLEVMEAENS